MKLTKAVTDLIGYRRNLGMRCITDARTLRSFCKYVGIRARVSDIGQKHVEAFLHGQTSKPISRNRKWYSLRALHLFLRSQDQRVSWQLPDCPRYQRNSFVPYIVTQEELRRILDATKSFSHPLLQSQTLRSVLLVLYGAGLRISEALALKLDDVQLAVPLLRINDSKFYKNRLVPLGSQLSLAMAKYAKWRKGAGYSQDKTSPFFVLRDGTPVNQTRVRGAFESLRRDLRLDRAGQRPRLHDLRHSFAVHRLLQWYRQGADVQRLLPKLSVYLGHVRLSCTQAYLSMTPELLREANARFERYVSQGVDHEEW